MNQEKIGKLIENLRKKNNLTQNELANKLGVTYQAVSKWETGKNIPDIGTLKEISKLFNVDINDLLEGNIKNKQNKTIKILIGILAIVLIIIIIFLIIKLNSNFEFKMISSTCNNYEITGSAAYNKDKTNIYISNISYCGSDEKIYKEISCALYEKNDDIQEKISDCNKVGNDTSISEFLDDIKISIKKKNNICSNNNLYLRINFKDDDNKIYFHDVGIDLKDNCK